MRNETKPDTLERKKLAAIRAARRPQPDTTVDDMRHLAALLVCARLSVRYHGAR